MYRSGLGELDARLIAVRGAIAELERLDRMQASLLRDRERLSEARGKQERHLVELQRDLAGLEGLGFTSLFKRLFGGRAEAMEKKHAELLAARLEQELIIAELIAVEEQMHEVERRGEALAEAPAELTPLLAEKEAWMQQHGGPASESLFEMSSEATRLRALVAELDRAKQQGTQADELLQQALELLGSARSWGLLGGALIGTSMSRERVDEAKQKLAEAQSALSALQRSLDDVELRLEVDLEPTRFERVGSYIVGSLLSGWSEKIRGSHSEVSVCREKIADLLSNLDDRRGNILVRLDTLDRHRAAFIEAWGR